MYKPIKNVQRVYSMKQLIAPNNLIGTQMREFAYNATAKATKLPDDVSNPVQIQHDPVSPLYKVWSKLEIQSKHTEKQIADQRFKAMMGKIEKCLSKAKTSASNPTFHDVKRPMKPIDKAKKTDSARKDTNEELKCLTHKLFKEKETTEKLHKLMQLEVEQREQGYPTEVKASRALNPPKNINYVI